jgi:hypothetical protein
MFHDPSMSKEEFTVPKSRNKLYWSLFGGGCGIAIILLFAWMFRGPTNIFSSSVVNEDTQQQLDQLEHAKHEKQELERQEHAQGVTLKKKAKDEMASQEQVVKDSNLAPQEKVAKLDKNDPVYQNLELLFKKALELKGDYPVLTDLKIDAEKEEAESKLENFPYWGYC